MLLGGAVAWPLDARTQQPTLVKRIGLMANLPLRPIENFRNRLSERGFIEGQNLMVEYRFAEGLEERYADFAPSLTRVAVLGNSLNPLNRINLETAHRAAQKLSIGIEGFEVRSSEEVKSALRALVDARAQTDRRDDGDLQDSGDIPVPRICRGRRLHRLRPISPSCLDARPTNVDRILKGERPGNLPVQQATAFEIIVDQKAAAGLGLTLPRQRSGPRRRGDRIVVMFAAARMSLPGKWPLCRDVRDHGETPRVSRPPAQHRPGAKFDQSLGSVDAA